MGTDGVTGTAGGAEAGATTEVGLTTTGASTDGAGTTTAMVVTAPDHTVAHTGGDHLVCLFAVR